MSKTIPRQRGLSLVELISALTLFALLGTAIQVKLAPASEAANAQAIDARAASLAVTLSGAKLASSTNPDTPKPTVAWLAKESSFSSAPVALSIGNTGFCPIPGVLIPAFTDIGRTNPTHAPTDTVAALGQAIKSKASCPEAP
jgi:type II secretory pathway pseudopilin PulG